MTRTAALLGLLAAAGPAARAPCRVRGPGVCAGLRRSEIASLPPGAKANASGRRENLRLLADSFARPVDRLRTAEAIRRDRRNCTDGLLASAAAISTPPGWKCQNQRRSAMGTAEIRAQVTLENSVDRAILDRGHAVETEIRRTTIEGIVAVGAMVSLVVPEEVVTELGLRHAGARTIVVHADEHREERPVAGPVTIEIGAARPTPIASWQRAAASS